MNFRIKQAQTKIEFKLKLSSWIFHNQAWRFTVVDWMNRTNILKISTNKTEQSTNWNAWIWHKIPLPKKNFHTQRIFRRAPFSTLDSQSFSPHDLITLTFFVFFGFSRGILNSIPLGHHFGTVASSSSDPSFEHFIRNGINSSSWSPDIFSSDVGYPFANKIGRLLSVRMFVCSSWFPLLLLSAIVMFVWVNFRRKRSLRENKNLFSDVFFSELETDFVLNWNFNVSVYIFNAYLATLALMNQWSHMTK